MTIKAVLRNGQIHPTQPLPAEWRDGQELLIEEPTTETSGTHLAQWVKDLEVASASISTEEHDRFRRALNENEQESKKLARREWELP